MTDQANKDLPTTKALRDAIGIVDSKYFGDRALDPKEHDAVDTLMKSAQASLSASAPAALSTGDLRDRLAAVSSAIADQDDREAQAILREALRLLDSAPAAGSVPSDEQLMKIAERHGFALAQPGRYGIEWLVAKDNTVPSFLALVRALLAQYGSPAHSAAPEVAETLRGIVNADWTQWGELACPEEFVRWAKARAAHVLSLLSAPQEGK